MSGSGLILTNFHVVGEVDSRLGPPGALLSPTNRYAIAISESSRQVPRVRWYARVVRGDVRLDLAVLQIVADANGTPTTPTGLAHLPIAPSTALEAGEQVWAVGFPAGLRTIDVSGGYVSGFEVNAFDQVAWIRTSVELNPGTSGGALLDSTGQLVGVVTAVVTGDLISPVELARPIDRTPRSWLDANAVSSTEIYGIHDLELGRGHRDRMVGDQSALGVHEEYYYRVAGDAGLIEVDRPLDLVLLDSLGRVVRRGRGQVWVRSGDPEDLVVRVSSEVTGAVPLEYEIRFSADRAPQTASRGLPSGSGFAFGNSRIAQ